MYDLAIIGGGPAALAGGVYAARKQLKTIFIAEQIGGQSVESPDIQNWIGTPHIPGTELAKALEKHLREYASGLFEIKSERAAKVEKDGDNFLVHTPSGAHQAKAVLVATGGARKKLDILGAEKFEGRGIAYCASCDGPFYSGKYVAVVGGGNAGFETATQLLSYAKSVTLVHRQAQFNRADPTTVTAVLGNPRTRVLTPATPVEVKGGVFVSGLVVKNEETGAVSEIPVEGIFVAIGMTPATSLVEGLVELDERGRIIVDPRTGRASVPGIWAAGDCSDGLYHQNNIAAGDAVKGGRRYLYFPKDTHRVNL